MTWDVLGDYQEQSAYYDGWPRLGWSYFVASVMRKSNSVVGNDGKACISHVSNTYGSSTPALVLELVSNTPRLSRTPHNIGWVKTPAGWKRDRTHRLLGFGNLAYAGRERVHALAIQGLSSHNGITSPFNGILATATNCGLFGEGPTRDMWFSHLPVAGQVWNNAGFDLSFLDVPGLIPAPVKANKAFRMYLLMCMFWFDNPGSYNEGVFMGDGTVSAAEGITVNLRSGNLATLDPEATQTDTLLATFTYGGNDFSIPDTQGRIYAQNTKTVAAAASGTIGYAEILGATRADGVSTQHGRTKLYIPVSTVPTANYIATDLASTVSGQNISIYDFGLQFKVGE